MGGEYANAHGPASVVAIVVKQIGDGATGDFVIVALVDGVAGTGAFREAIADGEGIGELATGPVGQVHVIAALTVDVGHDGAGEAVDLVGTDEVHFAGQAGLVAGVVHAVGPRGLVGGQGDVVVPDSDAVEVLAGHEGGAGGDA